MTWYLVDRREYLSRLKDLGRVYREVVGPTFGQQVANKAITAIIFSLIVIAIYVAIRFEAKYVEGNLDLER